MFRGLLTVVSLNVRVIDATFRIIVLLLNVQDIDATFARPDNTVHTISYISLSGALKFPGHLNLLLRHLNL
jgi:hypothetical protein